MTNKIIKKQTKSFFNKKIKSIKHFKSQIKNFIKDHLKKEI